MAWAHLGRVCLTRKVRSHLRWSERPKGQGERVRNKFCPYLGAVVFNCTYARRHCLQEMEVEHQLELQNLDTLCAISYVVYKLSTFSERCTGPVLCPFFSVDIP